MKCSGTYFSIVTLLFFSCATDTELFPNFYKFRNGYLMSEFGAFRATDLDGGVVLMNFTCILEVCKDECEEVIDILSFYICPTEQIF